jgi:hypothetical protein
MTNRQDKENNEIWVFLSHSHKDYEKVSLLRNLLEKEGYRPIMFYLKCLGDNSEIDNLIKREIDCRAYFILCDSDNSRHSTWVQEEEKYIKSKGRVYEIIDIESGTNQIKAAISRFKHRTSAFISYSRRDSEMGRVVQDTLSANGYTTFIDKDNILPGSLNNYIENAITKHSNEGFVIFLLSKHSIASQWCLKELQMALGDRGTNASSILVVSLDGTKPQDVPELKGFAVRWIDTTGCGQKEGANKVVRFLDFYNTSYRRVYNLCWELSKLEYKKVEELQEIPYPLPNNIDKTQAACRYILGLGVPTDIEYAISLFKEAAKQGDENAIKILEII